MTAALGDGCVIRRKKLCPVGPLITMSSSMQQDSADVRERVNREVTDRLIGNLTLVVPVGDRRRKQPPHAPTPFSSPSFSMRIAFRRDTDGITDRVEVKGCLSLKKSSVSFSRVLLNTFRLTGGEVACTQAARAWTRSHCWMAPRSSGVSRNAHELVFSFMVTSISSSM
jgi:hypothetical protein